MKKLSSYYQSVIFALEFGAEINVGDHLCNLVSGGYTRKIRRDVLDILADQLEKKSDRNGIVSYVLKRDNSRKI